MAKEINPNLKRLAELTHNPKLELPDLEEQAQKQTPVIPSPNFSGAVDGSFILSYDGPHKDFAQELIAKSNEIFKGTKAEIPVKNSGEVENMYALKRMALVTTITTNQNLRDYGLWPITPLQSEILLKEGKLPKPKDYWAGLGLILYDKSTKGTNPKEAQALYESIKKHKNILGLSEKDLEKRLLIVNAGLKKDSNMPHRAGPIVLPGITEIYLHDTLQKTGKHHKFEYGLDKGLPSVNDLGKGKRTLYMPDTNTNLGLRVLCRGGGLGGLNLDAGGRDWVGSNSNGRVNFALQGRAQK